MTSDGTVYVQGYGVQQSELFPSAKLREREMVSQIFASWNQMVSWLSQLQRLRRAG
jgi:hypothetical protein